MIKIVKFTNIIHHQNAKNNTQNGTKAANFPQKSGDFNFSVIFSRKGFTKRKFCSIIEVEVETHGSRKDWFAVEKRRIRLEINGVVCGLITQESEEYMQSLANEVGELMREITEASPYITREAAALTVALSYCDDSKKGARKAIELQERIDELEVEAEIWQEDKEELLKKASAEADAALTERLEKLEQENTALSESVARLQKFEQSCTELTDENAALRETVAQMSEIKEESENLARQLAQKDVEGLAMQGELDDLRSQLEIAQAENTDKPTDSAQSERINRLEAENAALRSEADHAEQEKRGAISAAKRAVEEAKRRIDEMQQELTAAKNDAEKYKKEAQAAPKFEAYRQTEKSRLHPEDAAKRKNPLRYEAELEKEGLVSFFEKKK